MVVSKGWEGEEGMGSSDVMGLDVQFEKMRRGWVWPHKGAKIPNATEPKW